MHIYDAPRGEKELQRRDALVLRRVGDVLADLAHARVLAVEPRNVWPLTRTVMKYPVSKVPSMRPSTFMPVKSALPGGLVGFKPS